MNYELSSVAAGNIFTDELYIGQRSVLFGSYSWRVLDMCDGRALLLSEYIIGQRAYHNAFVEYITWEECALREYLNVTFLKTFSDAEQGRIAHTVNTVNSNADNPWFGTSAGSDTTDRIFLLSIEESVRYFGDSGQLQRRNSAGEINDNYNDARKARREKRHRASASWWLRSPGYRSNCAAAVTIQGRISLSGNNIAPVGDGDIFYF
jgi:hypothetical protein